MDIVNKLFRFISEEVELEGRVPNPDDTEEEKIKKLREKGLKRWTREGRIPNPDDTEEEKIKKLVEQEKEEPKEPEAKGIEKEEPKEPEAKGIEKEEPKEEEKPAEKPEEPVAGEEIILVLPEEAIAGLVTPEEGEAIAKEEQEELAKAGETHPPAALYSLAKEAGISKSKAERYWKETKEKYKEWMGKSDKDLSGRDYQYIMGVVKKRMKLPVKPVESKTVRESKLADSKSAKLWLVVDPVEGETADDVVIKIDNLTDLGNYYRGTPVHAVQTENWVLYDNRQEARMDALSRVKTKTTESKSERYFVADLDKLELIKESGELKAFVSKDEATKYIQENKLNAEVVSL